MNFQDKSIWAIVRNTTINIGLAILSSAAVVTSAELVFSHIISADPGISKNIKNPTPHKNGELKQYHPLLGYDGIPNLKEYFSNSVSVSHNERGLRGPVVPYARTPGIVRIMLIGDSQTWGWGLNDGDTVPIRLQEIFDQQPGFKTEVINLGMNGYGTDQEFLKYLIEGSRYSPDIVILTYFVRNDLREVGADKAWGVPKPRFFLRGKQLCLTNVPVPRVPGWPDERATQVISQWIDLTKPITIPLTGISVDLTKSRTFQYFNQREFQPFYLAGNDNTRIKQIFSDPAISLNRYLPCMEPHPSPEELKVSGELNEGIDIFFAILEQLRQIIEERHGRLLVVISPDHPDYEKQIPSPRHAKVADELKRRNFESLDILEYGLAEKIPSAVLYGDFAHFSSSGAKVAASAIAKKIISWR